MDAKLRKKEIRKLRKAGRKERWERFKEYSKRAAKAIKETAVIGVSSVAFALVIGCGAISDNKPVDPLKDKDVQEDKFNYSEVEADVLPEGLYYKDEEQGDVSEVETEDLYGDGPEADEETGETEIEEPFCGPIATSNGLTITGTPELIQNIETPMESYFDKEIVVDEKLIYNPEGMDWTETETVSVSGKNIYDSAENMVATEFSEITYGVEFTNELGNGIPVCSNGMAECSEELKNENMGIEIQLMGNYWIITEMDSENGQLKLGQEQMSSILGKGELLQNVRLDGVKKSFDKLSATVTVMEEDCSENQIEITMGETVYVEYSNGERVIIRVNQIDLENETAEVIILNGEMIIDSEGLHLETTDSYGWEGVLEWENSTLKGISLKTNESGPYISDALFEEDTVEITDNYPSFEVEYTGLETGEYDQLKVKVYNEGKVMELSGMDCTIYSPYIQVSTAGDSEFVFYGDSIGTEYYIAISGTDCELPEGSLIYQWGTEKVGFPIDSWESYVLIGNDERGIITTTALSSAYMELHSGDYENTWIMEYIEYAGEGRYDSYVLMVDTETGEFGAFYPFQPDMIYYQPTWTGSGLTFVEEGHISARGSIFQDVSSDEATISSAQKVLNVIMKLFRKN